MTIRKLHSTSTHGSANSAAYHVVYQDGRYRVYDKAGKFRLSFAPPDAANAYIALHATPHGPGKTQPAAYYIGGQ